MPRVLAVVLLVVIPASAAVAYYALGRYTAMDPAFIEMMERQSAIRAVTRSAICRRCSTT